MRRIGSALLICTTAVRVLLAANERDLSLILNALDLLLAEHLDQIASAGDATLVGIVLQLSMRMHVLLQIVPCRGGITSLAARD